MNKTREEILQSQGTFIPNPDNTQLEAIYLWKAEKAMSEYAKQQSIAFDKWKVEEGWEWSSSKWFKNKEVFWHQVPVGEYLTTDQLWCKFIEHQIKQSSKN